MADDSTDKPLLGLATTGELLYELSVRNNGGQSRSHENSRKQVDEHIRKLRLAFSLRYKGLEYRTVDE